MDAANNTIKLVGELPGFRITGNNKNEIIGEAHFLRAMATFDLLRYFGEFYDVNSPYRNNCTYYTCEFCDKE